MNTTATTTGVKQLPTEQSCALELYDSAVLSDHVTTWWTFLHAGVISPRDLRNYLHGAMIAIPCHEGAAFYELSFLGKLIDSYSEDTNVP